MNNSDKNLLMNNSDKVDEADDYKCPHITEPFIGCYGIGFDSANIQKAVMYCLGDYIHCEIYIEHEKV